MKKSDEKEPYSIASNKWLDRLERHKHDKQPEQKMMPFKNDEINETNRFKINTLLTDNKVSWITNRYHKELPAELERWYEYLPDAGHCILCLPSKMKIFNSQNKTFYEDKELNSLCNNFDIEKLLLQSDSEVRNWIVPASVKAVQRGYRIVRGYVVSNLECCSVFGLIQEDGDDEY